jgi:hypothetical protein
VITYHAGDKWQLDYLVTVYPEVKAKAALDDRAKNWQAARP